MRANWRECALGDLARIKHGYAFKGEFFGSAGTHVVLTPGNFHEAGGFKERSDKAKWYSGPVPEEYVLAAGDLIVAMTEQGEGLLGSTALVPRPGFYLHNQRLGLVTPSSSAAADRGFLYYLFNCRSVRQQIRASANGAKIRHTSPTRIYEVKVRVPDIATQRRIASILSAYDDLIENNTRRIAILEEMARRIYEEWFVRFRFPGHEGVRMVESELGLVPEGWSVQGLYDVADLTYGFPFKSSLFNEGGEGLGVVRIRDISDDYTATRTTEDVDLKYRVADGDILVGMDGAFHMGRWAGGVAWLNQRVVRFRPKARIPRSWLFWVTEEPIKTLEATIVGTTVAHLSARDLKELRVLVPSKAVLEAAGSVLEPMSDLELTLKKKNAVLRVTRDLLLPKLISGELDVSAIPEPEALAA
jgi:type I restriction enzyme S subunit